MLYVVYYFLTFLCVCVCVCVTDSNNGSGRGYRDLTL